MLLEWPEHSKKLIEGVNTLHSDNRAFHDLTLSAEGKTIKAHRVILASASTYFRVSKFEKFAENYSFVLNLDLRDMWCKGEYFQLRDSLGIRNV